MEGTCVTREISLCTPRSSLILQVCALLDPHDNRGLVYSSPLDYYG